MKPVIFQLANNGALASDSNFVVTWLMSAASKSLLILSGFPRSFVSGYFPSVFVDINGVNPWDWTLDSPVCCLWLRSFSVIARKSKCLCGMIWASESLTLSFLWTKREKYLSYSRQNWFINIGENQKKKMFANCDALNINESEHDDTCALSKNRSTQSDQSLRFVLHD